LLRDGSIERVDVIDATTRCCTVAGRGCQSSFGARNSPWARKAASTRHWRPAVKLKWSGAVGSVA